MTEEEKTKEIEKRRKKKEKDALKNASSSSTASVEEGKQDDIELPFVIEGYVGKSKGVYQVADYFCIIPCVIYDLSLLLYARFTFIISII